MTESQIINTFLKEAPCLPNDKNGQLGPGWDAAVLTQKGKWVISTDQTVEGVHFDLSLMSPFQAARRSVVLAAPDVISQGAYPEVVFLSLALPHGANSALVRQLAKGFAQGLKECGALLAGGDTTRGPGISLDVIVLGRQKRKFDPNKLLQGGWLATNDATGASAEFLKNLEKGKLTSPLPYQKPQPNFSLIPKLFKTKNIHLLTDISDGLVRECQKITQWLNCSVFLMEDFIRATNPNTGLHPLLHGGEDGVFLVAGTGTPPPFLIPIGELSPGKPRVNLIKSKGGKEQLKHLGYQHFSS